MKIGLMWSDDWVRDDDPGSRVLDDLQSVDEFCGESGEEGIIVVNSVLDWDSDGHSLEMFLR